MREGEIIEGLLRPIASHPAARGLADDAAVWSPPMGRELVLTHDVIAEGVHYLGTDDPSDIAWKLVAVNLSDLAAKGAEPAGVLIGLGLARPDDAWLERFASGLARVLAEHGTALFGGDTTTGAASAVLGCTAIGHVPRGQSLSRTGARPGDDLYVTGTIGDAGLGLAIARGEAAPDPALLRRYRLPAPRLAMGQGLAAAGAHAAMDVSDGLLIDASRMAKASGVRVEITLTDVPLSEAAAARLAPGDTGRLAAATAGDDYELLIAAPPESRAALLTLSEAARLRLTRVGRVSAGEGFSVIGEGGAPVPVPRLGYEHGA
ncbi:thiamine-phosphate kinase [Sphingosinicella sp.]|uniref:thiamine-phosphate kinase n=1 Tax=Sphingosinicella sp. TaxID=1917971 RepID=UPI00260AF150|nr:thiamine-phosphate kinase [Sphingosinicella sp.]